MFVFKVSLISGLCLKIYRVCVGFNLLVILFIFSYTNVATTILSGISYVFMFVLLISFFCYWNMSINFEDLSFFYVILQFYNHQLIIKSNIKERRNLLIECSIGKEEVSVVRDTSKTKKKKLVMDLILRVLIRESKSYNRRLYVILTL